MKIQSVKKYGILVFVILFLSTILNILLINFAPLSISRLFLNPNRIRSVIENDQKKDYEKLQKLSQEKIKKDLRDENGNLLHNQYDPLLGNTNNPLITVIEYIDYRCVYCKKAHEELNIVLSDEKYKDKIKVVVKMYPVIGGDVSLYASEASVSLYNHDKSLFSKFHSDLFSSNISSNADVDKILSTYGLTFSKIKNDKVRDSIIANFTFARDINISGTPAFIIGDEFIPGFISADQIKQKIDAKIKSKPSL